MEKFGQEKKQKKKEIKIILELAEKGLENLIQQTDLNCEEFNKILEKYDRCKKSISRNTKFNGDEREEKIKNLGIHKNLRSKTEKNNKKKLNFNKNKIEENSEKVKENFSNKQFNLERTCKKYIRSPSTQNFANDNKQTIKNSNNFRDLFNKSFKKNYRSQPDYERYSFKPQKIQLTQGFGTYGTPKNNYYSGFKGDPIITSRKRFLSENVEENKKFDENFGLSLKDRSPQSIKEKIQYNFHNRKNIDNHSKEIDSGSDIKLKSLRRTENSLSSKKRFLSKGPESKRSSTRKKISSSSSQMDVLMIAKKAMKSKLLNQMQKKKKPPLTAKKYQQNNYTKKNNKRVFDQSYSKNNKNMFNLSPMRATHQTNFFDSSLHSMSRKLFFT